MATVALDGEQVLLTAIAAGVTRILLVEDDATIARATERLIRRSVTSAVEVVALTSAEAATVFLSAIAITGSEPFDVVVSDYRLAGPGTGADVLRCVRALTPQPRFLFLSSDERAGQLGVPHLDKPCSPSVLRDAILKLFDGQRVQAMPLDDRWDLGSIA